MKWTNRIVFLLLAEKRELIVEGCGDCVRLANRAELYRCMICAFNILGLGPYDCSERKFKRKQTEGYTNSIHFS